ncbi:ribosome recycling factor [Candidatus Peregrinibacteria bacterium]|nr:ribosome recycling factor [Candidatus Peregrinibacteria bacterium]
MIESIIQEFKAKGQAAIDHLHAEFSKIQTGRASAALVETLMVDSYGSKVALKSVASISIPDAKTVSIQPWDRSQIPAIEKAIRESNLGLNPQNNGIAIHLNLPPLTEERRKELVKVLHKYAEEARIALRNCRHDVLAKLKEMEKEKEIGEDMLLAKEKEVQKGVDDYNAQIEEGVAKKEKEIMTI